VFVLTTSCDHCSHISGDPSGSFFLSKYLKTRKNGELSH
jgi:hypothetical protein